MIADDFCISNWPIERCNDGLFHHVSHKLRLAGPGWRSTHAAQRAASSLAVTNFNATLYGERYKRLFGEAK